MGRARALLRTLKLVGNPLSPEECQGEPPARRGSEGPALQVYRRLHVCPPESRVIWTRLCLVSCCFLQQYAGKGL